MVVDVGSDTVETQERFTLRKDGIWAAKSRRTDGMTVICRSGCLWVTWERGGDRILGAGERLLVDGADRVVIQGMEDSRVEILEAGGAKASWLAALRECVARVGLWHRTLQNPIR